MPARQPCKATEHVRVPRRLAEEMLRNLLHEHPQITSMDDLLNSLNERSEGGKATKRWSDTLIMGLFIVAVFVRGSNEQDVSLQMAAGSECCASNCASILFCSG